jgi:uncharacterized protein (DUF2252 family)
MPRNIVERIQLFNHDRIPEMVAIKYHKMRTNAFAFFRGTCHLFYEDWTADTPLNTAPRTWICGDLHLENFGTYKGDNRLTYFDVNDFDEAALAPCTWDLVRFLTSLQVAASTLKMTLDDAEALCQRFLDTYAATLAKGQIRSVERATAIGLVRKLLHSLKKRQRAAFLDAYTQKHKARRTLKFDDVHLLASVSNERQWVAAVIEQFGQRQNKQAFFNVLDVARRVAGTGSLGIKRYAILVEGKGSPDRNYIIDLKEERVSSLQSYLKVPQPSWSSQAERAVAIQMRYQGTPPALLATVNMGNKTYIVRELQSLQDRVNLADWKGKLGRAAKVITTMAEVVAWGQLRSGGRQGSAIADELIAFGKDPAWRAELMNYARHYAAQVKTDFREYAAAYDQGALELHLF